MGQPSNFPSFCPTLRTAPQPHNLWGSPPPAMGQPPNPPPFFPTIPQSMGQPPNPPLSAPHLPTARLDPGPQQLLQLWGAAAAEGRGLPHPLHPAGLAGHRIRAAAGDDRLTAPHHLWGSPTTYGAAPPRPLQTHFRGPPLFFSSPRVGFKLFSRGGFSPFPPPQMWAADPQLCPTFSPHSRPWVVGWGPVTPIFVPSTPPPKHPSIKPWLLAVGLSLTPISAP